MITINQYHAIVLSFFSLCQNIIGDYYRNRNEQRTETMKILSLLGRTKGK